MFFRRRESASFVLSLSLSLFLSHAVFRQFSRVKQGVDRKIDAPFFSPTAYFVIRARRRMKRCPKLRPSLFLRNGYHIQQKFSLVGVERSARGKDVIENFNLLSSFLFSGQPIKKKGTVRRRADIFSALLSMQGVKLSSLFLLSRDLSWIDGFRGIKVKREIETDRQKARIPPHTHFSSLITSVAAASHCEMWEGTKTRDFLCQVGKSEL